MKNLLKKQNLSLADKGTYVAYGTVFDGTNDHMTSSAALTVTDSSKGIFSCWIRIDGGNGTARMFYSENSSPPTTDGFINASNIIRFIHRDSTKALSLTMDTANTYLASSKWIHVLASWDTNFSAGNKLAHLYVDDVSDLVKTDTSAAFTVDYSTGNSYLIGASLGPANRYFGALSELYFIAGEYLDFSNVFNRRKFITASKRPAFLGPLGKMPLGVQPTIYLRNQSSGFFTNYGLGGAFTVTGSLDPAATSPSVQGTY